MFIFINGSAVSKSGNKIIQFSENIDIDINNILDLLDKINTAWKGQDATAYINAMKDKYVKGLMELSSCIKDYGTYLIKVPAAYEMLDNTFASKNINI